MKNTTLVTLLVLLTFSCRTSKHRLEEQKAIKQVSRSEFQKWQYYLQQDSNWRYWHFASDSIFYFHPDSGLWAKSGWLYAEEQWVHKSEQQSNVSNRDSAAIEQYSSKTEQKRIRKQQLPWYIYVIALLGIGSLGYFYFWRKRI
ncbi:MULTISPECIES: hypothetical protein [Sphingobacterium]|uniref:hypothetical protein n=1 Tax=Sphingobacterium TaxID=28453 RepID=UPI0013D9815C|nr:MULTISPECIES: hypothetical protein [unclassified Sphingobacterium]